ncbi:hypothetical protein [Noviherbaspirillum sp. ST9]|uniref:hypothetical protein n=1 Tax=Noviherbaspirillum sp. ST9 TaxID=3401606 RepID=UPI003B586D48
MTTLTIKDLRLTEELDGKTMSAVRGGYGLPGWAPLFGMPKFDFKKFSIDASQTIGQSQNVVNNNGNNAAFVGGIGSTVSPPQAGDNGLSLV